MSCIITYKGKQYSEEQFKEYFINNKNEFATSISKNKDVIDSFKRKMEAIDGVFKDSPELAAIGSKAQYMQYLSTIFKTSKVKDIVYHGTDKEFDKFLKNQAGYNLSKGRAFFFTKDKEDAKDYSESKTDLGIPLSGKERVLPVMLDIKSPHTSLLDVGQHTTEEEIAYYKKNKVDGLLLEDEESDYVYEYVVFEPEQIHILGSKKDIEKFKNWIGINNVLPSQKLLDNLQFKKGDC